MGKNINHAMLMLSGRATAAGFGLKCCQSVSIDSGGNGQCVGGMFCI